MGHYCYYPDGSKPIPPQVTFPQEDTHTHAAGYAPGPCISTKGLDKTEEGVDAWNLDLTGGDGE